MPRGVRENKTSTTSQAVKEGRPPTSYSKNWENGRTYASKGNKIYVCRGKPVNPKADPGVL